MPSRRQFLSAASAFAATAAGQKIPLLAQQQSAVISPHVADLNGDGVIDDQDRAIVERALFARRGYDIAAAPGYEPRADVFARGLVDRTTVDNCLASLDIYQAQA